MKLFEALKPIISTSGRAMRNFPDKSLLYGFLILVELYLTLVDFGMQKESLEPEVHNEPS